MKNKQEKQSKWDVKEYVKNMNATQTCRWMALLKAITIISEKAEKIGMDPDMSLDNMPTNQIFTSYIEPESETIEYWLNEGEKDPSKKFFLDYYLSSESI